ncbi:MAG: DUF5060 domain-containing protein [Bacteroidales bacterium]|nr:DUF5060 domain-containing protein [Bacteroidales bacterium]
MRRKIIFLIVLCAIFCLPGYGIQTKTDKELPGGNAVIQRDTVEKWDVFEVELISKKEFKKPFEDVTLTAWFTIGSTTKKVTGFFDGNSTWKIRFMPEETGQYNFRTESDYIEFSGLTGTFQSAEPSPGNHGPVSVDKKYHFSYADGTPCFIMGTTIYNWIFRPADVRQKTLESLRTYRFNKARMVVFPQYFKLPSGKNVFEGIDISYAPDTPPYKGKPYDLDYRDFNIDYFRNLEDRIRELRDIGVEADVILFHNYDFGLWGIDDGLSDDDALFYLNYLVARISSLRNVWWSLANEYDLVMPEGKNARSVLDRREWDRIGNYLMENDPYNHPRSVHEWSKIYPNRPWMTHVSCQKPDTYDLLIRLKKEYQKPVICDEYQYEGNIIDGWGNLTPQQAVLRHWLSVMAGAYATHGDCYVSETNIKDSFFTYGGEIKGQGSSRLKFLKEIVNSLPFQEMAPLEEFTKDRNRFCLSKGNDIMLFLLTSDCPDRKLNFNGNGLTNKYDVTVYDTWNRSVVDRVHEVGSYDASKYQGLIAIKAVRIK